MKQDNFLDNYYRYSISYQLSSVCLCDFIIYCKSILCIKFMYIQLYIKENLWIEF